MNEVKLVGKVVRCYVGTSKKGVPYSFLTVGVDEVSNKGLVVKNNIPCRVFGESAKALKDILPITGTGMVEMTSEIMVEVKGKLQCKASTNTDSDGRKIYETYVVIEFIKKSGEVKSSTTSGMDF